MNLIPGVQVIRNRRKLVPCSPVRCLSDCKLQVLNFKPPRSLPKQPIARASPITSFAVVLFLHCRVVSVTGTFLASTLSAAGKEARAHLCQSSSRSILRFYRSRSRRSRKHVYDPVHRGAKLYFVKLATSIDRRQATFLVETATARWQPPVHLAGWHRIKASQGRLETLS